MGFKYVKELKDVTKKDFSLVGGKGANLGEMIQAQLPVPGGFVVLTDAYEKFIEENNLKEKIYGMLEKINKDNLKEIEKASKEIKDLFERGKIPSEVLQEIDNIYESLNSPEVAVRSSATAEDLPGISFAGQYSTYLNVRGREEVYKYVKKCWGSLWNSRAVSYRIDQGIGNKDIAHGVVVQKLINAQKSGILFTANPVNGRRDQILINSSWGLGEAIVGGEVTPDQWVVDKKSGDIVEEKIAKKEMMTIRKEKGIELVEVPKEKQKETTLRQVEVAELLELAIKVEKYFGSPQDIEWADLNGRFYLVQSRPITSLYPMPEVRNNKKDLRVYINVNNYSQAMKEPFTPMGGDVLRSMVADTVNKLGKKNNTGKNLWWYQEIAGRGFIDITDFMRTEKSWSKFKKEDSTDKDPITTKALLQLVERNRDAIINPKEAVSLVSMLNFRLIKCLVGITVKYCYGIFSPKTAREKAIKLNEDVIAGFKKERQSLRSIEEKLSFIENNMGRLMIDGFGVVFYVAASSTYIEKAKKIMEQYLEDVSDLKDVEKSVPYSVTTEMGMEILKIAKAFDEKGQRPAVEDQEIRDFLKVYGHRSNIELDAGTPTWKEEPQYVLDLINTYIDSKSYQEGIDRFYRGKEEAEKAILRIREKLEEKGQNRKAKKVEKLLRDFREMFGIREQSKFLVTGIISIVRDILLEVGEELEAAGRLKNKMDVFYITMEDIRSNDNLKELVIEKKEKYHRDFKKIAPRLLTSTGESIYSAIEEETENALVGIPVSPGVYEGKVKILNHPEEGHKLQKGEILVTTGTNPAWTPLFLKLGALIMETGGPISHGSVVAREYGLPAVAGVAKATKELSDGDIVRVNGETGRVELVESKSRVGE